MTRRETHFATLDNLIFVLGRISGPHGVRTVRFVVDTGAAYTTLTPEIVDALGYGARERLQRTRVRTAIGSEQGYVLEVSRLSVLGIVAQTLPVNVFDLGHDDIDGLVGMNLLSLLNYEVRSAEYRILVEPVTRSIGPR